MKLVAAKVRLRYRLSRPTPPSEFRSGAPLRPGPLMAAGFSPSTLRPQLSTSRQSTFDAYDYVLAAPNTLDTVCTPLRMQAVRGIADTNGTVREFWDAQSMIGTDVRSAILKRCGCTNVSDSISAEAGGL